MCDNKRKPHVHAELIKAWADGAVIQFFCGVKKEWVDIIYPAPVWNTSSLYRIKPEQTDLEKYGVEVGDVWKITPQSGYCFTVRRWMKAVSSWSFEDTDGTTRQADDRMVLLFRRGVVDKL